jgi:hypothetical protein
MSLYEELRALIERLRDEGIDYALCGGLAMAAHGWPRATMDVDLLIQERDYDAVRSLARGAGFTAENPEFTVAQGRIRIRRLVKIAGDQAIPLDLILVGALLEPVWAGRMDTDTPFGPLRVLSRRALARMKELRASGTDQDDIRRLKEEQG